MVISETLPTSGPVDGTTATTCACVPLIELISAEESEEIILLVFALLLVNIMKPLDAAPCLSFLSGSNLNTDVSGFQEITLPLAV